MVTTIEKETDIQEGRVVFDAGPRNTFTLSGLHFMDGILICDNPEDTQLVRNYIKQTRNTKWQEVPYDATNPRHNRMLVMANNSHIVTGIQTSNMLPNHAQDAGTKLAASIIAGDDSFTQQALANQEAIQAALASIVAPVAPVATSPKIPTGKS